jgi:hypothetical protein
MKHSGVSSTNHGGGKRRAATAPSYCELCIWLTGFALWRLNEVEASRAMLTPDADEELGLSPRSFCAGFADLDASQQHFPAPRAGAHNLHNESHDHPPDAAPNATLRL